MNGLATAPAIYVADMALYLRKTGWRRSPHPNDRLLVFRKPCPGEDDLTIVLASKDEYADAPNLISNALALLAETTGVTEAEVTRSVHAIDRDILSIRFLGPKAGAGGLPLETAMKLVSQLRDLLAYAACVEENPRPYFPKTTSIGRKYTEQCVFGHTFPGSFGFTIESPTGPGPFSTQEDTPQPFERRVLGRIMRGLGQLQEAVLSGDPEIIVAHYPSGLNANLCELLEETLKDADESEIEYSIAWSPEWFVAPDLARLRSVRLEPGARNVLSSAARQMRRLEESKVQTIVGKVVALQSDASTSDDDSAEDFEQVATILWEEKRGRKLRVRVSLESADYATACDAHKTGVNVSVTGTLEKVGKFWKLMAPAHFQILSLVR